MSPPAINIMKLLKEIADIRSGYPFRTGIEESPGGKYRVVQIKDVTDGGDLTEAELVRTEISNIKPDHSVRADDILFASRGSKKLAMAVSSAPENAVLSYQVFAIKAHDSVLPAYLSWYLNQRPAQRYIEENSMGSHVTTISKDALAHLAVPLPPIEVQRKIVEVHELFEKEKELVRLIEKKRAQLVETTLLGTINR